MYQDYPGNLDSSSRGSSGGSPGHTESYSSSSSSIPGSYLQVLSSPRPGISALLPSQPSHASAELQPAVDHSRTSPPKRGTLFPPTCARPKTSLPSGNFSKPGCSSSSSTSPLPFSPLPSALRPSRKFRADMPGASSAFIPTINAITTSQELQWMVQPTVITSMSSPYSRSHPYSHAMPGLSSVTGHTALQRPGVIKTIGSTVGRRRRDEQLSPEEEEKRRVRRERNKLAAAKCRNRRRELTDKLQAETEKLEEEKSVLQKEIADLQKEKDKLEFMLVAHTPICKISPEERRTSPPQPLHTVRTPAISGVVIKEEPQEQAILSSVIDKAPRSVIKPISIAAGYFGEEPLNTPVVVTSTPPDTPSTSNFVFTYPSGLEQDSPMSSSESCSKAHRRSSSSGGGGGDQSSDSLNSPTLLAL